MFCGEIVFTEEYLAPGNHQSLECTNIACDIYGFLDLDTFGVLTSE